MSGVARFLVAFLLSLIPALSLAQTAKSDYSAPLQVMELSNILSEITKIGFSN